MMHVAVFFMLYLSKYNLMSRSMIMTLQKYWTFSWSLQRVSEFQEKISVCWHYRVFKYQAFKGYLNRVPKISKELYPSKPIIARTACYFFRNCNQRLIKDGINMYCSTFKKFTGLWKFGHAIHMMWLLWKLFPVWLYMSYTRVSNFLKIC